MNRFLLLLTLVMLLFSQEKVTYSEHTNRFSVVDGLSSSVVQAITQDEEGFLWIGTRNGLNRFDGSSWKNYPLPSELSSNQVSFNSLAVDSKLGVWIGSIRGIAVLKNETWIVFTTIAETKIQQVQKIEIGLGRFWLLADGSLFSYDGIEWKKETKNNISDFLIHKNSLMLIDEHHFFGSFKKAENEAIKFSRSLKKIVAAGDDLYLISGSNHLLKIKDSELELVAELPSFFLTSAYDATTKRLYLACENGLFYFENGRLNRFKDDYLSSAQINSLYISYLNKGAHRFPILWIGTFSALYQYRLGSFQSFQVDLELSSITAYKKKTLFGTTANGLFSYNGKSVKAFYPQRFPTIVF